MTKENSKRLYDHYVEIGNDEAAEDMLNKYPDFAGKPSKKKEAKKVEEEQPAEEEQKEEQKD